MNYTFHTLAIIALPLLLFSANVPFQVVATSTPVWNIVHAYNSLGKVTVDRMREAARNEGVNAVEIDMLYHTDRFWAAHDYEQCDANYTDRSSVCLELEPLLQEVEANVNITLLWIDPKGQWHWGEKKLSDLAVYVRSIVKTKAVWWGVGESGPLSTGDLEELVAVDPLPALEGYSFDYGKNTDYFATVQDVYLRARKAGVANIGYSNMPGFNHHSCDELNKAMAYRAEGKLGRVLIWTINSESKLKGLYQANDAVYECHVGADLDEPVLVGPVEGVVSDYLNGIRTQRSVVDSDSDLRLATADDVFWPPSAAIDTTSIDLRTDNILANGGAEMPPMPNGMASSWRLSSTAGSGVFTLSTTSDCPSISALSGDRYFALGKGCTSGGTATETMYQDIVMNAYSTEIDAGKMSITVSAAFFYRGAGITAALVLEYVGMDAAQTKRFELSTVDAALNTWVPVKETVVVPGAARVARVKVSVTASGDACATSSVVGACSHGPYLLIDDVALMLFPTTYESPSTEPPTQPSTPAPTPVPTPIPVTVPTTPVPATPQPSSTVTPPPTPTTLHPEQSKFTITFGGAGWQDALHSATNDATQYKELLDGLQEGLGKALGVPAARVNVTNLRAGSLVVTFAVSAAPVDALSTLQSLVSNNSDTIVKEHFAKLGQTTGLSIAVTGVAGDAISSPSPPSPPPTDVNGTVSPSSASRYISSLTLVVSIALSLILSL